ncbi:hypothetical protein VTN77DRAFT_4963 [Rasamsonia byssochlamydoides]|uniref:uncharacterized protein n=1 Tax=Rasamsonia byssochlamydoides TaxID=89139 RepID=UPI003742FF40
MSYRGKPSRACRMCKARKVKYDEKTPRCTRCHRNGDACIYPNRFDLFHRDQTSIAARHAQERWRTRTKPPSVHSPPSSTTSSEDDTALVIRTGWRWSSSSSHALTHEPLLSFYQLAFPRFVYDFITPSDRAPQAGTLRAVPRLYSKSSPGALFHSAASAVTLANFANRFKVKEAAIVALRDYTKALRQLAVATAEPGNIQLSEMVLVVFLLALYEMLSSPVLDRSWLMHVRGAASVLRMGQTSCLPNVTEGRLYGLVIRMLLVNYMAEGICPPAETKRWLEMLAPVNPRVPSMQLSLQVATICSQLKQAQKTGIDADLLYQALDLDSQLDTWYHASPPRWPFQGQPLSLLHRPEWSSSLLRITGAPKVMYVYADSIAALDANLFRASRLHLNLTIFDTLSSLGHDATIFVAQILQLIDEICSTIPTMMQMTASGEGDPQYKHDIYGQRGHQVMWPLVVMKQCFGRPEIRMQDVEQRAEWVEAVYDFVANELGYAKVPEGRK